MTKKYRKYYRRKYKQKYALTYPKIGKKVYNDLIWLKNKVTKLNVEVKYIDNNDNGTIPEYANQNYLRLFTLAQGDDSTDRDGDSVKSMSCDIRLLMDQNATPTNQRIRFIVLLQKFSADSITPQLADTHESGTVFSSFRNIPNSYGFKVLTDQTINLDTDKNAMVSRKFHYKLNHHMKFDAGDGLSVRYGQLWYLIMTSEATNRATYDLTARYRFVDN